jgi:subtilisin family serine protease
MQPFVKRRFWISLAIAAMLGLQLITGAAAMPTISIAPASPPSPPNSPPADPTPQPPPPGQPPITSAGEAYHYKLQPKLRELARSGKDDEITVRIIGQAAQNKKATDMASFVKLAPLAQPDDETGLQVWYGRLSARNLEKLAGLPQVARVDLIEARAELPRYRDPDQTAPRMSETRKAQLRGQAPIPRITIPQETTGWWDIGPGHESKKAWDKGYTGSGVRVANIDTGVDFCHPDLYGTWATYSVAASRNITYNNVINYYNYYDGWPLALSPSSNQLMIFDLVINGGYTDFNTFAYGFSKFADTRTAATGSTIIFDSKVYTTTGTASLNPVYHIGYHPLSVRLFENAI